ncbi:caspase-10 isoform 2-T2 [Leptodactylus fuscus]|uniref:caspase-10 isoform X2 n=1 Tax=Leptodactylus fuscus TaxID=238119 RepID=UPI003F4E4B0C
MDFNTRLISIESELTQEDLESLKFLCLDLVSSKKLLAIRSNLDLFKELQKNSLLDEDQYELLAELLYIIGQHSLLKHLGTDKWTMQNTLKRKRTVSLYRRMLFELYENISSEDLKTILFILNIPKKYEENKTFLEVLYYLEKNDQLSEDKLDVLEKAVAKVSPDLLRKIKDYSRIRDKEIQEARLQCEDEYDDKTPLSIEAQEVPSEDAEIVQHISETANEKGLMDENTEISMAELSLTEQPEIYSMDRKHRGYCLIINNSVFVKHVVRLGTEKDAAFLTNVFTWLGMDVEIRNELSAQEIRDCLTEFSKKDHTERDCFVCCILTHGKSRAILGTDDEVIPISEIIAYFSPKNCTTLAGKPKLFFIQACQYSSCAERGASPMPNDADVLVGMSAMDGHYSIRHSLKGTWYIQALCENLVKMVPKGEDILSILTKVNKDVSEKEYFMNGKISMKQMPQPSYTLLKKLVFPKPPTPFKSPGQQANDF